MYLTEQLLWNVQIVEPLINYEGKWKCSDSDDTHWNITPDYCKNMNVLVYEFHVVNLNIIKLFKS